MIKELFLLLLIGFFLTPTFGSVTTTNRTTVYTNYKDRNTNIFGVILLLVGFFLLLVGVIEFFRG